MSVQWKDITQQLFEASKSFKLFEIACPQIYDLQDSMQGNQINDQKVDIKTDLKSDYTLNNLIASKTIKHPSTLSLADVVAIYDYVFGFQIMYMKQHPIAQTIYTFTYLYDRQLSKQNQYLVGLIDSINTFGSYFQHLSRQSMTIRDDDNTFSLFGFNKEQKPHEQIIEQFLKLQKQLDIYAKNNKNQQKIATALNSRIKGRRFLHLLCKEMGSRLDMKNADKVKKSIQSFIKRIDDIINTLQIPQKPQGVFNQNILKTLRANVTPRQIKYPNIQETYIQLKNMANQIGMFIPIPQAFSEILDKIDQLLLLPLNKLSKSYIVSLFFKPKADYLDSAIPLGDAIGRDLVDWFNLKQTTVKSQKYIQFTTQIATFMSDVLLKIFLNRARWQWEASRIYDNFNYLVHFSNEFDKAEQKREVQLVTYAYNLGINHMIKQLQTGVQINLYYPQEYSYIFYYTQYLIGVSNKNSSMFLMKFDKGYMSAFDQKSLTNKIKKKVSPNMRKMYSSIIFSQGLQLYYSAMYKLFCVLLNDNTIKTGKNEKQRFISRFQIFRKVLFIKPANYDQYREELKRIGQNRQESIKGIQQDLKQAQSLIQKLSILEEGDIFTHTKNQLASLGQLCIRQSLEVMRIRMSKQAIAKVNIQKLEPYYVKVSL